MSKKMSISLCLTNGANSCGPPPSSSSDATTKVSQPNSSKMDRDREMIENIYPTGCSNGEKMQYPNKPCPRTVLPQYQNATVSMMYGSGKSKKTYSNTSNRKKQTQQHIFNSLKVWNLKITPSGLDKFEDELSTVVSTVNQKKEPVKGTQANEHEPSNRVPTAEIVKLPVKKKTQDLKNNKFKTEEIKEQQVNAPVGCKADRGNVTCVKDQVGKKHSESAAFGPTTEATGDGDGVPSHSSQVNDKLAISTTGKTPACPSDATSNSTPPTSLSISQSSTLSVRGNQLKHQQKSYARPHNTSSTAVVPNGAAYTVPGNGFEKSFANRVSKVSGIVGQSNVSVMSLMMQGNDKLKEAPRVEHIPSNSNISSSVSKPMHANQHTHQHPASYFHTLGSQQPSKQALIHHQDHHQVVQPGGHQYSFDFLRDVSLKMSLAVTGGGSGTTGDNSMYCGSSQMNYNFTHQFQQHMLQHQHNSHMSQPNHSTVQSPHQHQPLLQIHRIMPQQQHYSRSQGAYGSEELSTQHCSGMNEPQSFSNYTVLNTGEVHNSIHGSKHFELSSYLYNQNGSIPSQHQQGMHFQHPSLQPQQQQQQQQQQQHHVQLHNYHQNNNYQYHNRNNNNNSHSNYAAQNGGRTVGGTNREDGGRGGGHGKKSWNVHGKGKNSSMQANASKHVNKVQSIGYGYRKNYQHYHNHGTSGGHQYYDHLSLQQQQQQHQQQHQQHQHHKHQHLHRNLVYVRGYDRGHGAGHTHEYSNNTRQQETEKLEPVHHEGHSPEDKTKAKVSAENPEISQRGEPNESSSGDTASADIQQDVVTSEGFREVEVGPETVKTPDLQDEFVYESKKRCSVPRSSSSSSVVSIPSTESSALSSNISQTHLHESTHAAGHDYESDSSHSSDFQDTGFRYSKYNQPNDGQVYRSSSSTSSGVSSSATYPPLTEFIPSTSSSLHASSAGLVDEFIVRSQSYHGSHQNLTEFGSGGSSAGDGSSPIGSPKGTPRLVTGTQSVPIFGALFGNTAHSHPNSIQFTNSQSTASFGSSSSLELALQPAVASFSSSSSLSVSSVPPNDFQSMQSGHPKTRSQSGRTSPSNANVHYRNNRTTVVAPSGSCVATTKGQSSNGGGGRKNNQVSLTYVHRSSLPADFQYTPADRFILRANDVEMKRPPDALVNGGVWDVLSQAIWEKFAGAQQSEEKYLQKMQLWRDLYISIKNGFSKYSLYLVGSTISGFGADSSDVDMCLVSRSGPSCYDPRLEALLNLSLVKEYFMSMSSTSFSEFSLIQAKVPILRFQDNKNGIEVDLNFNNCVGIRNTHLLHCYSQMDWRVRPLVLVVKLWAQHHNINDAKSMTISSYSLVLMVIHFLQCGTSPPVLPCLHAFYPEKFMKIVDIHNIEMIERIEPYQTDNKETLGELLLRFLEYYTKFDYEHYAISVRTSSIIPIEECRLARSYKNDPHHWKHLCIEEPFDFTNTARSVFDGDVFEQIKSTFATSWRMLKDSRDLSILFGEPLFTPVTSTLSVTS